MLTCTSRAPIAVGCCVALMLFLSVQAPAESPDWVREEIKDATLDPGELHYFHRVHRDCPLDGEHAARIIEEVLVGNRIQPRRLAQSRALSEHLFLDLWVSCVERGTLDFIYVIDAYLALYSPLDGTRLYIGRRFGRFGAGDRDSILQSMQDSVEDTATAFISANRSP